MRAIRPRARHSQSAADWIEDYTKRKILPELGLGARVARAERPAHGRKSNLLLVWPEEGPGLVVRRLGDPREARKLGRVFALLEERGVPAPRLLYRGDSAMHWVRHGSAVLAEELIEGEHVEGTGEAGEVRLRALGEALARCHKAEFGKWGTPGYARRGDGFDALVARKFAHRVESFEGTAIALSAAERGRVGAFLERSREAWGEGRPFAICHDKVHPGNVVFARGGAREKAWLIDWATMRLGPPGADLVTAMEEFCEGEAQEGVLREAYFGRLPAKVREARRARFERLEALHRAYYHLCRASAKMRRAATRKGEARRREARRALEVMWGWVERGVG